MSKLETIKRYHLIINKLHSAKRATFAKISDYLQQESEIQGWNFTVSLRTFHRDIAEIALIYGIYIKYDFSGKYYFIEDEFEVEVDNRMYEAFEVYHALNVREQLSQYIHFEKRSSQDMERFYSILHSIRNCLHITFSYQKQYKADSETRTVEPLILKEFKHRWYLVARDTYDDRINFYALDRLTDLKVQTTHYKKNIDFDVNEHLKYCFGIIIPDDETPYKVVLSFEPFQGKYIKSLPLHSSQKILIDNEEELRISLQLYLTNDFIIKLLSLGGTVKVIEPQELVDKMEEKFKRALKNY